MLQGTGAEWQYAARNLALCIFLVFSIYSTVYRIVNPMIALMADNRLTHEGRKTHCPFLCILVWRNTRVSDSKHQRTTRCFQCECNILSRENNATRIKGGLGQVGARVIQCVLQ
jgi:hypothetical protein